MRRISIFAGVAMLLLAGCAPESEPPNATPIPTARYSIYFDHEKTVVPRQTDTWELALVRTPYPFLRDLPPADSTAIDGTYFKDEFSEVTPFPCRRCADYRLDGGLWRMNLAGGVFRIYYEVTDWRDVASFVVDGNRLEIFNDPSCTETVGVYEWELDGDTLTLRVIDDDCAVGRRARNLTNIAWTREG